ncbi:MAG: DUF3329 domain-containing protein, partial [Gammaproteobacteria bacterium]|nr:DUF3329 domain-containing protein [Gammaproteobacteria bacterium]NIU60832.1 DUF3329 domain-containing protein [Stutzerimonas stutzeri]NIV74180.1 DUF3329 domain-containing protein [Gammaproteobacteria bacterium]
MSRRFLELLLLVAAGAAIGWVADKAALSFVGALVGCGIWAVRDGLRAQRVLRWLNKADVSRMPELGGFWGEVL